MRESSDPLRQSPPAAIRASWTAWLAHPQFHRGLAIAAAAGAFLAFVGAFGTGEIPLWTRLAYWMGLALLGAVFGGLLGYLIQRRIDFGERPWRWAAIMTAGLSIPFTTVVFLVTTALFGGGWSLARLVGFFPPVLLVTATITGINFLVHRGAGSGQTAAALPDDASPRFLERLPARLRGADLWAVEAEDHYLRLHTSKGQDLILMRLSDAVAELDGVEGARTHRSWWVAREAVTDVKRGDGRATLTLKGGAQIPVSRAYARTLRAAGWF